MDKVIKQYQKGDVPECGVAYLQGVILKDGRFIYDGREFFIEHGCEKLVPEKCLTNHVSDKALYIEVPCEGKSEEQCEVESDVD